MPLRHLVLSNTDIEGSLFYSVCCVLLSDASSKTVYGMHESVSDSHPVSVIGIKIISNEMVGVVS